MIPFYFENRVPIRAQNFGSVNMYLLLFPLDIMF